jgi:hypothetical protein
MGYKGPCYSQSDSSATAGARAGSIVVLGVGIQPQPNTTQTGAGGYPMPPYLLQTQAYQPMVASILTVSVFTPSSPLKVSSAHGGLFSTPTGYIPNTSLGMPPEYMVFTSIEAPTQAQNATGAGGQLRARHSYLRGRSHHCHTPNH